MSRPSVIPGLVVEYLSGSKEAVDGVTPRTLAKAVGRSLGNVYLALYALEQEGFVKRIGAANNSRWTATGQPFTGLQEQALTPVDLENIPLAEPPLDPEEQK